MEVFGPEHTVRVVCALIINEEGEVLMTKRKQDKLRPGMWEMPGGKIDSTDKETILANREESDPRARIYARRLSRSMAPGEHVVALRREMREELGVETYVGPTVSRASFLWDRPSELFLYHVGIVRGNPQPLEADDIGWFDMRHALDHMPMCPAQYVFYPDVVRYISEVRQLRADFRALFE